MSAGRTYLIKIYDETIAQFEFMETEFGETIAHNLEVDPASTKLLPLNIAACASDTELNRFLEQRRIPKGRAYIERMLQPYGIRVDDTKGIIDLTRGTSVNDAYSVVPAGDDIAFADYNLFDNAFDEVLQIIAYTGVIPDSALGSGIPSDLAQSGSFPKTWRRENGGLVLYKAGYSRRDVRTGKEPFSEYLAAQVAAAAALEYVDYQLAEWQGHLCSTCKLFNSKDVAYVPFNMAFDWQTLASMTISKALDYFDGIQAGPAFRKMAVFDAIIANHDRHTGNFGLLRQNKTGEIVGLAPIYDNNLSLFTRLLDSELDPQRMDDEVAAWSGVFGIPLSRQIAAFADGDTAKTFKALAGFSFQDDGFLRDWRCEHPESPNVVSSTRLAALESYVGRRVAEIASLFNG